jgi:hypothetical protein
MAPPEAVQFDKALCCIMLEIVRSNPRLGPVYLSKVDIADGVYRIWVQAADIPNIGVLLPAEEGDEWSIGFTLVLPMDWKESPPIFTSATETITDLANVAIRDGVVQGPRHLEVAAETNSNVTTSISQWQLSVDPHEW